MLAELITLLIPTGITLLILAGISGGHVESEQAVSFQEP